MYLDLLDKHPDHAEIPDLCLITYFESAQRRLTVFREEHGFRLKTEVAHAESHIWEWKTEHEFPDADKFVPFILGKEHDAIACGLLDLLPQAHGDALTAGYAKKAAKKLTRGPAHRRVSP